MNEDKIIEKLIEHDDRLDRIEQNMSTKEDIRNVMTVLDDIANTVKKIREDHVFALEWLKRLQNQVEKQDEEIRQIKIRLQMA